MSPKRALEAFFSIGQVLRGRDGTLRPAPAPRRVHWFGFALFLSACSDRSAEPAGETPVILSGSTMGTYYRVTVASLPETVGESDLRVAIERRLDEVNERMSTYLPESELSRFNRYSGDDWFSVSLDTATVVAEALRVYERSDGAFDVTVGPLVNLWGFGPPGTRIEVPHADSIAAARGRIGSHHLEARVSPPALKKARPDLYVDLSGIAKGYAVDALAEVLGAMGIDGFVVDIGGDMLTGGRKRDGALWEIAIESPETDSRSIHRVLPITDRAIATSGDYRNYFEVDGLRYSHEIDPRSGYPIRHSLVSVSVLEGSCMRSDAWATALIVLGPEKGFHLAEEENLAAFFIVKGRNGFFNKTTDALDRVSQERR